MPFSAAFLAPVAVPIAGARLGAVRRSAPVACARDSRPSAPIARRSARMADMPRLLQGHGAVLGLAVGAAVVAVKLGKGVAGKVAEAGARKEREAWGNGKAWGEVEEMEEMVRGVGEAVGEVENGVKREREALVEVVGRAEEAEEAVGLVGGTVGLGKEVKRVNVEVERLEKEADRLEGMLAEERRRGVEMEKAFTVLVGAKEAVEKELVAVKEQLEKVVADIGKAAEKKIVELTRAHEEKEAVMSLLEDRDAEVARVKAELEEAVAGRVAAEEGVAAVTVSLGDLRAEMERREVLAAEMAVARELEVKSAEEEAHEMVQSAWAEVELLKKAVGERDARVVEMSERESSVLKELRDEIAKKEAKIEALQARIAEVEEQRNVQKVSQVDELDTSKSAPGGFAPISFKPMKEDPSSSPPETGGFSLTVADLEPYDLLGSEGRVKKSAATDVDELIVARQARASSKREIPPAPKLGRGRPRKDAAAGEEPKRGRGSPRKAAEASDGQARPKRGPGRPRMTDEQKAAAAKARAEKKAAEKRQAEGM